MEYVAAAALGFAGGTLGGLVGVGGGVLFVPALAIFLDETQVRAEATSLLAILPTVATGLWRQQRYGNTRWRASLVLGLSSLPAVGLGVWAAESLPEATLQRLFAVLMLAAAAQLVWRARTT